LRAKDQPTVCFAVQGGVFAEGVDYPGDMLIGAIIVGPALPGWDLEPELLREYYEKRFGNGFDYAYTFPAMSRVVRDRLRTSSTSGLQYPA
jgi:DNA excision repair protein ERCC-2